MKLALFFLVALQSFSPIVDAQMRIPRPPLRQGDAPGGPGAIGAFPRPDKSAFGTTLSTPLWYTVSDGAVSELYYPHVDRVQTQSSFLQINDGGRVYDERRFTHTVTRFPQTSIYHVRSDSPIAQINKIVQVSVQYSALVIDYTIEFKSSSARQVAFVHNPAAEGTPGGDTIEAVTIGRAGLGLTTYQGDVRGDEPRNMLPFSRQFVRWDLPDTTVSVGFEGVNSPIEKPFSPTMYARAQFGNVAGALIHNTDKPRLRFRVIIAFSSTANWQADVERQVLGISPLTVEALIAQQTAQWQSYLSRLSYDKNDYLFENSIIVLKSCEDKIMRGAFIAAPANPGIPWLIENLEQDYEKSRRRVDDTGNGGYHRVWPRDLYHKALAMIAVGDYETALNVARWYKHVQIRTAKGGSFAQNMWVDGSPSWRGMQLDQTAFPIALIGRLVELKAANYAEFREMVTLAADFIMQAGPWTDQERWEENGGLSPNTLAAAVEGLTTAAWLEGQSSSRGQAYAARASEWVSNLKKWTVIKQGAFGQNYIARLELGHQGVPDPNVHALYRISNKRPGQQDQFREDEILDGGFLQWILAGLVDPKDPEFSNTLRLYDQFLRKKTYAGVGYLRYNFDSYGENHFGGAWPLLSAERAIVALERGEDPREHVALIQRSATPGGLIPEQDVVSVRPLAWSHAAYILMHRSLKEGRSFYIPRRNLGTRK